MLCIIVVVVGHPHHCGLVVLRGRTTCWRRPRHGQRLHGGISITVSPSIECCWFRPRRLLLSRPAACCRKCCFGHELRIHTRCLRFFLGRSFFLRRGVAATIVVNDLVLPIDNTFFLNVFFLFVQVFAVLRQIIAFFPQVFAVLQ